MVDVGDVGSGQINRGQAGSFDYGSSAGGANVSAKWREIKKQPPPALFPVVQHQEWA